MIGILRAVLAVGAGAGLVLGAAHLPEELDLSRPAVRGVVPVATTTAVSQASMVCPGPEWASSRGGSVTAVGVTAPQAVLPAEGRGAGPGTGRGTLSVSGLPAGGRWPASVTERGAQVGVTSESARSIRFDAAGGLAAGAVAVQRSVAGGGTGRGMTTAVCLPATSDAWLVGGGAEPGRRERLVLANPGPNPVTVDITVLGSAGPVSSPAGKGLVVPGNGRTVVVLDGIAGQERSPVVHVTAHGGTVAATLNDTWLDGLVPRGGDDAAPMTRPSREQILPGLALSGAGMVRVAVPGRDEAVVQLRLLTPDGPQGLPRDGVVRIPGRTVRDVAVTGLPAGAYAVQVRADRPGVAGALVERRAAGTGPSDFAWAAAAPRLTGLAGLPLPAGTVRGIRSELHLAAPGADAVVTVTTTAASGTTVKPLPVEVKVEVKVKQDSVVLLPLGAAGAVWVRTPGAKVRAAVVTSLVLDDGVLLSSTALPNLPLPTRRPALAQLP